MFTNTEIALAITLPVVGYMVISTIFWAINRFYRLKLFKKYGIPGPEPSFFSGNLTEYKSEPTPNGIITNWLNEYGDVFGYYIGEIPHVVVKDLEMLKQVMIKNFSNFCNRPEMFLDVSPLNQTILYLKDKRWKEVRSILTPTFSSSKIKLMTRIIEEKVNITLNVVAKHAETSEMFDIYELVQGLTLDVIADCALAMKTHCQENPQDIFLIAVRDFFRYAHNSAVEYAIKFPVVARIMTIISNFMKGGQMTKIIVENVKEAIQARAKSPKVKSIDILQMMLDHGSNENKGSSSRLTDMEVIANAYVFVLAGYETTATALAFTFYLLVKHPEIQKRLQEEIDSTTGEDYTAVQGLEYLDQVFSESMRYYPPVTGFVVRKCEEDCKIGSFTIPKGAIVQAPVWDIHHDPDLWPDPWRFDPDRFSTVNKASINNMSYLPFGIGPRNCIGARFAQLEAKMAIFRLLKKFTFEACEKTDDPLPLICPTVIINPENGVYVRARLREQTE